MSSRARVTVLAILGFALAGLALRLGLAFRDLDVVDRLFIPDDTYYTLSIARALGSGTGPTVDGVVETSGFQPLIAFLLAPVFALTDDPDTPLRSALVLLAFADVGTALLLGLLAHRVAGPVAALLAVAIWSLSPVAIANALNGLESSLAVLCQVAVVLAWLRARDTDSMRWYAVAGVLAGLALLARIDSAFVVGALGLIALATGQWRRVVPAAGVAALVVAPWWLYCTVKFGSPIPESGGAVREIVSDHRDQYLTVAKAMGWAAGTLVTGPFAEWTDAREWLNERTGWAVLVWSALAGVLAFAAAALGRRGAPLAALPLHALAILAVYSLALSALWFFSRYLLPVQAALALLVAVAGAALWRAARGRRRWAWPGVWLLGAALVFASVTSAGYLWASPETTRNSGLHGANGYRSAARAILAQLPPGSVVGAMQSGALSYFAPESVRVVNLDGVVDRHAREALREHRLAAYARERGLTHFTDWPFNKRLFLQRAGDPRLTEAGLRPVGAAPAQGPNDAFELYALTLP